MKRNLWFALACAALVHLSGCNSSGNAQNSTDMRVLNAVADSEPLDILVDDDVKVAALAFGATSPYAEFNSGSRDLKVRSSTAQTVLTEKSLSFSSGANSTLLVFGKRSSPLTVLAPDDTTTPSSGKFRVRIANLAPDAGAVDLYLSPGDIASSVAVIPATGYGVVTSAAEVTPGNLRVTFAAAGTQDVLFQSAPLTFAESSNLTVLVLPSLGGKLANAVLLSAGKSGSATFLQNPLARLKAVNAVPDATALNFKADGAALLSSVPFMGSSSYVTTTAGTRALQIELSNVPGSILSSVTKPLDPARDYTVLATGRLAAPQVVAIADDNTLPVAGFAKLRFVNAMTDTASVDALLNFASQANGVAFAGASSYYQVAPGTTYTITFATPGGITVMATLSAVELDAGAVYSAYLFGTPGAAQARLVRDR